MVRCTGSFDSRKESEKSARRTTRYEGDGRLIEEVLLPIENVSEVKKGQQKVVEKRLWPGYLLVKMNLTDESWHYVKNTAGVIDFLGGDKPTAFQMQKLKKS